MFGTLLRRPKATQLDRYGRHNYTSGSGENESGYNIHERSYCENDHLDASPPVAETDREAIEIACRMAVAEETESIRIVQIANTKQINRIWLSSAYLPEIDGRDDLVIDGELESMKFDDAGNQIWPTRRE